MQLKSKGNQELVQEYSQLHFRENKVLSLLHGSINKPEKITINDTNKAHLIIPKINKPRYIQSFTTFIFLSFILKFQFFSFWS